MNILRKINVKKILCITLSALIILFIFAPNQKAFASERTLGDVETELNAYIMDNYSSIEIGGREYINLLTDQMMYQTDQILASNEKYSDMKLYISKLLYETGNPNYITEQTTENGEIIISTTQDFRNKTLSDVITEAAMHNAEDKAPIDPEKVKDHPTIRAGYSIASAVRYAHAYATSYNTPTFKSFSSDCTNFVSQCINAGGKAFNTIADYKSRGTYSTTSYWYHKHWTEISPYHRYGISTSFIRVGDFYTYWKNHGATIIQCSSKSVLQIKAAKGDVVQLKNGNGEWYHSIIITEGSPGSWYYSGHSSDRYNASVSGIDINTNTAFRIIRF